METRTLGWLVLIVLSCVQVDCSWICKNTECYCSMTETTEEVSWRCYHSKPSRSLEPLEQTEIELETLVQDGPNIESLKPFTKNSYSEEETFIPIVLVLKKSDHSVEIDCSHFSLLNIKVLNESVYDSVPELNLTSSTDVSIRFCPLPKTSFKTLFNVLNITNVISLSFKHSPSNISLSPPYFDDLPSIKYIRLTENSGLTELHEDLFEGTPRLKELYMRGNSITELYPGVFRNLTRLATLDLGNNKISKLDDSIFQSFTLLKDLIIDNNVLVNLTRALFSNLPNLETLDISGNNISTFQAGVFDSLKKLTVLQANKNQFQKFPSDLFSNTKKIKKVKIHYHKKTLMELPPGLFSNLPDLDQVVIVESRINEIPPDLFWNSSKIKTISLTGHKKLTSLPQELFRDCKLLSKLDLNNNGIKVLPDKIFQNVKNLNELNLRGNKLENITNDMFDGLNGLHSLDLSFNKLTYVSPVAFDLLPYDLLTSVDLSHNLLTFDPNFEYSPLKRCIKLQMINLSYNRIDRIYQDWITSMTSLKHLDLRWNNFTFIPEGTLESILSNNMKLDLSHNNIAIVDLRALELIVNIQDEIKKSSNEVILKDNPIVCNCSNYHLFRYTRRNMTSSVYKTLELNTENVKCAGTNILIDTVHPTDITCRAEECPVSCRCSFVPYYTQMTVDCSSASLVHIPQSFPTTYHGESATRVQLILRNNSIDMFPENTHECYRLVTELDLSQNALTHGDNIIPHLPRLEKVNLSKNNLKSISEFFVNQSSSPSMKSLYLSDNPWSCDCDSTQLLVTFISNKRSILVDSENILCAGQSKPLSQMTAEDYCPTLAARNDLVIISLGILGLLFGLVVIFYYRYQHEIKVWMFSHRILLCWLTEEDMDSDKTYDAFVSFTHEDEIFVMDTLIPELEKHFKICHHMRDFMPGEWIHNQILESVAKSRRTIIVLSEEFLKSAWGLLEFRTAHLQAVKDNCARVIILIYGEMPSQDAMDDEMKAYMKMNTYIKWDDTWFWEKLKYALPHAPSKPSADISMTHRYEVPMIVDTGEHKKWQHNQYSAELMKKG